MRITRQFDKKEAPSNVLELMGERSEISIIASTGSLSENVK